jgi:hypothetical protein
MIVGTPPIAQPCPSIHSILGAFMFAFYLLFNTIPLCPFLVSRTRWNLGYILIMESTYPLNYQHFSWAIHCPTPSLPGISSRWVMKNYHVCLDYSTRTVSPVSRLFFFSTCTFRIFLIIALVFLSFIFFPYVTCHVSIHLLIVGLHLGVLITYYLLSFLSFFFELISFFFFLFIFDHSLNIPRWFQLWLSCGLVEETYWGTEDIRMPVVMKGCHQI